MRTSRFLREHFAYLVEDEILRRVMFLWIFFLLLFFFLFLWKGRTLPPELPLFYSLPPGEEQLESPLFLFLIPLFPLFFFAFDCVVGSYLYAKEKLAVILLFFTTLMTTILFFITCVKIIFLIS